MSPSRRLGAIAMFLITLSTSVHADSTAHELAKHLKNPADVTEVINSPTMSAATQFCQDFVHDHYKEKQALAPKQFVELNAHCIAGNFQTVAESLGIDVQDYEPVGGITFANGVTKNLSADDAAAIKAFHEIKK